MRGEAVSGRDGDQEEDQSSVPRRPGYDYGDDPDLNPPLRPPPTGRYRAAPYGPDGEQENYGPPPRSTGKRGAAGAQDRRRGY